MKILYGVPSEGMGHATRSQVVIQHLLDSGHDVRIATSDRAYALLEEAFPGRCFRIEGFHLKYDRGSVDKSASFAHLMATAPESLARNVQQYRRLLKQDVPDAVISDFESFAFYVAKLQKIPLLSVDNMQVINRCDLGLDVPADERESFLLAKTIIKGKVPFCQRYLVSSFFDAPPRKPNTEIVPPILRSAVIRASEAKWAAQDHILVYQTASAQDDLISILRGMSRERFVVYGLHRDEVLQNVTLRSFSEEGFIRELATCRAVITNGGFSLISEAVFLKRPVCSFPLSGQFEQFVNGAQIERMGYGRRFARFSGDSIKAFLYDTERFTANLKAYRQDGNRATFAAVDRFLEDVERGGLPADEAVVA